MAHATTTFTSIKPRSKELAGSGTSQGRGLTGAVTGVAAWSSTGWAGVVDKSIGASSGRLNRSALVCTYPTRTPHCGSLNCTFVHSPSSATTVKTVPCAAVRNGVRDVSGAM